MGSVKSGGRDENSLPALWAYPVYGTRKVTKKPQTDFESDGSMTLETAQIVNPKEIKILQKSIERRNENLSGRSVYQVIDFILYTLFVMLLALAIRAVIFEPVRVDGTSMNGTVLSDKDFMLVDKVSYAFFTPQRGDIVVLFYPEHTDSTYVKRIMGLPGETVSIENGTVYINGVLLEEPYLDVEKSTIHDGVWVIPEDEIFVLGDNRNISRDSTSVGTMKIERIIGRASAVLHPFAHMKMIDRPVYEVP